VGNIVLGVTGSIAAYRAADLVREFRRRGHRVRVVMTRAAQAFVSPLTFETLSGERVATHALEQPEEWSVEHVGLARWGEALVVAPATANVLAKMACGIADDFLTTLCLAFEGPVMAAPAMNPSMWKHPAVRGNCKTLEARGVRFVAPAPGVMACGEEGVGRLAEVEGIAGKNILVTAGATAEPLDRVRVFSNLSSGKMGYALADRAYRRGANVALISGPTPLAPPAGVEVVRVTSGEEMFAALKKRLRKSRPAASRDNADVLVMAAAVSDIRPKTPRGTKAEKQDLPRTIAMAPVRDILKDTAPLRKRAWTLGFAAEEPSRLEQGALRKLREKRLDAILANPVSKNGVGFGSDENEGILLLASGRRVRIERGSKAEVAERIWDAVEEALGRGRNAARRKQEKPS
jgi:phosphopantothenoylcysteine decarboxylase/phosphopantothenate--cysteine ligase